MFKSVSLSTLPYFICMSSTQRLQLFHGIVSIYFNTVVAGLIMRQMYEMLRHPVLGALTFMIYQETHTAKKS